jgi:hypothetical protein
VRSLERRLRALEEQASLKRHDLSEDEPWWEKEIWLARAQIDRNQAMDENTRQARSLIRLFRTQNRLFRMSAEELIERIVSWRPVPDGGRSRATAEREVALAIYNREADTENMVCPPGWRESFVCGDELRKRYMAIPEEVLAEGFIRLRDITDRGWDEEEYVEWHTIYEGRFGITAELVKSAIGPSVEEITEENCQWALHEYAADVIFGEKGYRIQRHMKSLSEEGAPQ